MEAVKLMLELIEIYRSIQHHRNDVIVHSPIYQDATKATDEVLPIHNAREIIKLSMWKIPRQKKSAKFKIESTSLT